MVRLRMQRDLRTPSPTISSNSKRSGFWKRIFTSADQHKKRGPRPNPCESYHRSISTHRNSNGGSQSPDMGSQSPNSGSQRRASSDDDLQLPYRGYYPNPMMQPRGIMNQLAPQMPLIQQMPVWGGSLIQRAEEERRKKEERAENEREEREAKAEKAKREKEERDRDNHRRAESANAQPRPATTPRAGAQLNAVNLRQFEQGEVPPAATLLNRGIGDMRRTVLEGYDVPGQAEVEQEEMERQERQKRKDEEKRKQREQAEKEKKKTQEQKEKERRQREQADRARRAARPPSLERGIGDMRRTFVEGYEVPRQSRP